MPKNKPMSKTMVDSSQQQVNVNREMDHIYEEISDNESSPYREDENNSMYLEILDNHELEGYNRINIDTAKKSVRFNRNSNNQFSQSRTELKNSILKKSSPAPSLQISPGTQDCLFSHSPSSNSSASSSFSSGQIYTSNSICSRSPSLTSTHSVAFNQMIDSFLNRFKTNPINNVKKAKKQNTKPIKALNSSLSNSSTSSSQSSLSVESLNNLNSKASSLPNSKENRLSVRVSNLTLDDLKLRQRMLCHQQHHQQIQQNIVQFNFQTLSLMNNINYNTNLIIGHCTSPVQV